MIRALQVAKARWTFDFGFVGAALSLSGGEILRALERADVQAPSGEHLRLALRHVEPAPVLGGVMGFQLP
jgi:hypothetical protein